MMHLNTEIKLW